MACACQKQQVEYVAKLKDGTEFVALTATAAQGFLRDNGGGTVRPRPTSK